MNFLSAVYFGCAVIWKNCYAWAISPSCENHKNIFIYWMLYNLILFCSQTKVFLVSFYFPLACVSNRAKHRIFCSLLPKDTSFVFFNGIPRNPSLLQGMHEKTQILSFIISFQKMFSYCWCSVARLYQQSAVVNIIWLYQQ